MINEFKIYFETLEANDYSPATISTYKQAVKKLESGFKIESLGDLKTIRKIDFIQFVNGMSGKTETKNTFLRSIYALVNWLNNMGLVDVRETFIVKFGNSKLIPVKREPKVVLNEAEVLKVIGAGENLQERFMIAFLFHTFLRRGEAANIKLSDITGCRINIVGKGGKHSFTVLTDALCEMLGEYLKERRSNSPYLFYGTRGTGKEKVSKSGEYLPMSGKAINDRVKRAAKNAGIDPEKAVQFTAHRCRGTGITISNRTRGVGVTQRLARHSDIKTTMRYDANTMETVADHLKTSLW